MTHPDSNIFRRKHWKGGKKKVGKMRKRVEPIVSTPDKESVFFKRGTQKECGKNSKIWQSDGKEHR